MQSAPIAVSMRRTKTFMTPENPFIFLLEDSFVIGAQIERIILNKLPDCRLVWARSLEEAHVRSFGLRIALFLLDIMLPDGSGLDFLLEMQQAQPAARAIILSGTELPKKMSSIEGLGVLRFLHKPVESTVLIDAIRSTLSAKQGASAFRANLHDLTPMDVLQLKCLSAATTLLEFQSHGEHGRVHIVRGEVIHAEAGSLIGVEAVYKIIGWKGGQIAEKPHVQPSAQTVDRNWQALFMEAAQMIDERGVEALG